jgi:hypothetical protein
MPAEKNDRDIEIIPPNRTRSQDRTEWVHISFGDSAKAFSDLPLHKRILLGASWLAGLFVFAVIVFLILASAVLIWIPLLLATAVIASIIFLFRTKFRRR